MNNTIQTFAGHQLKKQNFKELRSQIFEAVLLEMSTRTNGKPFVTPEQFVVKHKARFGQVNACLDELVRKKWLKEPMEKDLGNGRTQKYYHFNLSPQATIDYIKSFKNKSTT